MGGENRASASQTPGSSNDIGCRTADSATMGTSFRSGVPLVQEQVRAQLLEVQGCSESEKRAHVKRLLVQWHPDRHPENVEMSTAIFQHIQQLKSSVLGI